MKTKKVKLYKKGGKGKKVKKGAFGLDAGIALASTAIDTYSTIDAGIEAKKAAKKKTELEGQIAENSQYTSSRLEVDPEKEAGTSSTGFYRKGGAIPKAGFGDFIESHLTPFKDIKKQNVTEIASTFINPLQKMKLGKERKERDASHAEGEQNRVSSLDEQDITNAEQGLANGGKVPKGDFGITAAIVGVSLSAAMAAKKKADRDKQEKEQEELNASTAEAENAEENSKAVAPTGDLLPNLPEQEQRLAAGGNIQTKGGKLEQIASDTSVAKGRNHATGGIKLYNGGKPLAEIENKETLKEEGNNIKVYSDRLTPSNTTKTFAEVSENLAKKRGKLEKSLEVGGNAIKKNSVNRMVNNLKGREDRLFEEQEQQKKDQNIKQDFVSTDTFAKGGAIPKAGVGLQHGVSELDKDKLGYKFSAGDIAQGVSNTANLVSTFTKPKVPKPVLTSAPVLDTNVSKNAERAAIKEEAEKSKRFVKANTSQSRVAVGRNARIGADATTRANLLTSAEQSEERGLKNQNIILRAQTADKNAGIVNKFRDTQLDRKLAQRKELSDTVANTAGYVQRKEHINKELALDEEKIKIYGDTYNNSGTTLRSDIRLGRINTPFKYQEAMKKAQAGGRQADLDLLAELVRNNPNLVK